MKGDPNDGLTYREALAIGTKADGATKCTYATIYADPNGKQPLFSLQRDKTNYNWLYNNKHKVEVGMDENGNLVTQAASIQLADGMYFFNDATSADKGLEGYLYEIEIPIVRVDEIADTKCVPATLLPDALDLIKKATSKVKKTLYKVWLVADPGSPAYPNKQVAWQDIVPPNKDKWRSTGNSYTHYEFTYEEIISPKYQKLLEVLEKSEKVYIKPDAFSWEPLDARNATITITDENGQEITVLLDDYIADKKAAFEKARKMLILAGGAALL